jgi:hypothetical protein
MSLLPSTSVDIRELLPYPALQKLVTFPTEDEVMPRYKGPCWQRYGFISRDGLTGEAWERHKRLNMAELRRWRNVECPGKEIKRGKEDKRGVVVLILR